MWLALSRDNGEKPLLWVESEPPKNASVYLAPGNVTLYGKKIWGGCFRRSQVKDLDM